VGVTTAIAAVFGRRRWAASNGAGFPPESKDTRTL
jgi:hypothetical protein